ncbi:hypothetical protein [Winogradskyella sp.]|uniref:hypothetical protein n=1 Tax=Winogradskyella sp. TaxID=1883156 RepID=UPI0026100260|nr:hypothetical protein [Winogradskyella sp.]
MKQLESLTYTFDVVDGKLTGYGKAFLENEMAKAQFTMIGEYHGSKRISEFTNAIIPVLDRLGYKTMALEVGPVTGQQLNTLEGTTEEEIRKLHEKYLTKDSDGYINTPFPFFDYKEDAEFLQTVKDKSWNLFGIDQEFYDGYVMLIDKMFENLPKDIKAQHLDLYSEVKSSLQKFYKDDQEDKQNLHVSLSNSELFKDFLQKMSIEPKNLEVVDALKQSSAIYLLYNNRKWYENNATRIKYMKSQLRKGLIDLNFDLSKDKLLIKMGGYHLSKGFSPLSIYEVGNTLNEVAEYHGNTALNIGFMSRYSKEGDVITDNYNSENRYFKARKDLLQMGKKDQWVVIDLRPMIKGHFYYPKKFNLNPQLAELVQRYDLLIIPKMEVEGILNYDAKNAD